jgi:hypothetical protein
MSSLSLDVCIQLIDFSVVLAIFSNSPMRYPSPIYNGPPIPLNFGDSSFESSPEKAKARYKRLL